MIQPLLCLKIPSGSPLKKGRAKRKDIKPSKAGQSPFCKGGFRGIFTCKIFPPTGVMRLSHQKNSSKSPYQQFKALESRKKRACRSVATVGPFQAAIFLSSSTCDSGTPRHNRRGYNIEAHGDRHGPQPGAGRHTPAAGRNKRGTAAHKPVPQAGHTPGPGGELRSR